jgi:type VI protein secretion system component Hcp
MSDHIENMQYELTVEELDQVTGGAEQISFNFTRIEFKYKAQSAD